MKLVYKYWTKSKGIGGHIEKPEDFIVNEIIDKKFLQSFERTENGVKKVEGPYTLFLLKKRNVTTEEALRLIAQNIEVKINDIGYAGLKDKFAITSQYITIKNPKKESIEVDNLLLEKISRTNKHISIGNLIGNEFKIILHSCTNNKNIENITKELANGIPNYFGLQRFGSKQNNHIIGRLIVKRKFDEALEEINKTSRREYTSIDKADKRLLKFFLHAYQSWIFNQTLNLYMSKNKKPLFQKIPILGLGTKLKNNSIGKTVKSILKKEKIKPSSFCIDELKILCRGGERNAFIKVDVKIYPKSCHRNCVLLEFMLPKGSYATNVIREISKCQNIKKMEN